MKKTLFIALALVLALATLTGCGHEHEFTQATYEAPATCTICQETEGEVLTPDFVTYGIPTPLEVGGTYTYTTTGQYGEAIEGQSTLTSYEIMPTYGPLEEKEGYECQILSFYTYFDKETYWNHGANVNVSISNYYNIPIVEENGSEADENGVRTSKIIVNGVEEVIYAYTECTFEENADGGLDNYIKICIQNPIGHDGMVCGLANPGKPIEEGQTLVDVYTDTDYLLFRMDGNPATAPAAE